MTCTNCGAVNDAGRKFCLSCGNRLAVTCPTCGSANPSVARYCGECGTVLATGGQGTAAEPALPPIPAAVGAQVAAAPASAERRLLSILFADLVGFTPFAEERDAEVVREMLTRYFDLARDVIERYGGTVEKFIGDAVMAVWGAPVAREDDAERAVRAALDLVDAVRRLSPGLQARAGVLTGEAAVTLGATNQGMVAGDLVNTAARLQSVAPPGTVLVGEATHRASSKAIAFEEAGEQLLKGKRAPVAAWRALRVVAEVGGRNRSEALEAPFVGRDEELRLVKELFHATSREKRARLVSVVGPAGIGKSRLAWEFLKYVDGLLEAVWWHHGRSPAYGEGITFWALGEMVRGRAGLRETDDEATTRTKIAASVAEHVPDAEERRWIEPALLALLGLDTSTRGSEQLFGAWRTFFERLAATGPVVMVFEDLHWADTGTLDFIDHLLEWSRNVPIYVVTLARPELLDRRPDWGARKRSFTSVFLEPLHEPAMRELLSGLVPGLPETALRAIVARADGIPLYAVETVRMLVAEGRVTLEGDRYVPSGALDHLAVPETLTALIAARLDGLPAADRALLQDAAVLGQSFTRAGLSAVASLDDAQLDERLAELVARELLTLDADPRSPERGQYGFVQALIREVAYNTLARRDRKTRHLAAARFFEGLGSDELAGALAGHYLSAHANATEPAEADALGRQARIALRAAADRATALGSHEQAVGFLNQALTVARDPAEEAELLERAGRSASAAAHHAAAEEYLRRAVELHRGRGDRRAAVLALAALGKAFIDPYRTDMGLQLLEPGAAEFADLDGDPGYVALLGQLARGYLLTEQHGRAIEVADRVLGAAEHADLVEIVADTLVTKGTALTVVGRGYEGVGAIRAGLELAREHDLPYVAMRAVNNLGGNIFARDPIASYRNYREGLAEARRLGLRFWVVTMVANSAEGALWVGDWDWALTELDSFLPTDLEAEDHVQLATTAVSLRALQGLPIADDIAAVEAIYRQSIDPNDAILKAVLALMRSFVALTGGDFAEARRQALRWSSTAMTAPQAYQVAGRYALLDGDAPGAQADVQAAAALGTHGRAFDLRLVELRAGIAALHGRTDEAVAGFGTVLAGFRDQGLVWDEAVAALEMVILLDPALPEVQVAADRARAILLRLRARPLLDMLDRALARSEGNALPTG